MTMRRWRVYYNWKKGWPELGAVDNGTVKSQKAVQRIVFHPSVGEVRSNGDMSRAKKLNEPTWWLELKARAVFEASGVTFYGEAKPTEERMRAATLPQFGGTIEADRVH